MVKYLEVNSNDGWQKVKFTLIEKIQDGSGHVLIFNLLIQSSYWKQSQLIKGEINDLVHDREMMFEQLCIDENLWIDFLDAIEGWKSAMTLFSCDLYMKNGEEIRVELTLESGLISSPSKPFFELYIRNSRLDMKSSMLVDQTSFNNNWYS